MTVVGAVDDQGMLQSPGSSSGAEKKKKDKKPASEKPKSSKSKSTDQKPSRSSADDRIDELDKKWADRFNRLEALLLAKSIDQREPTFQAPKVAPTHPSPAGAVKSSAPFFRPSTDQPTNSDLSGTGHSTPQGQATSKSPQTSKQKRSSSTDLPGTDTKKQSTSKSLQIQPNTGRPSDLSGTGSPVVYQVTSKSTSAPARGQSDSSMDTDTDSDLSDRPPVDLFVEEGELSDSDQDPSTDPDQTLSEEQTYRETLRGIRSYMGWNQIPDIESTTSTGDDNPFAGPRSQPVGKVSVRLPTDDWLCNKMAKLHLMLVEGYPSRSSEAGGLLRDQFVRPPKSQSKWYGLFSDQKSSATSRDSVTSWSTDASKLNSSYSRIARAAGIAATPPPSRQITHDNLRRWEKSAREASTYCNQAAGFNRCLLKVQENMKSIRAELNKGKCSSRVSNAVEELQYLTDFNSSISQAMAKTMEHLSDFVFVTVANSTLARRDAYLSHLKAGIKPDTLASLRTAPLQMATLFPNEALKQAEQDIANFETKSQPPSGSKKGRFHPYERSDKRSDNRKQDRPAWKNLGYRGQSKRGKGKASHYTRDRLRGSSPTNDNQFVVSPVQGLLPGSLQTVKRVQFSQSPKCTNKTIDFQTRNSLSVNLNVVKHVLFVKGQSQKKDVSPVIVTPGQEKLKSVKNASFVTNLSCVQPVKNVATNQAVGARLQSFWQTWLDLGAGPKVVQILKEGYTLPFRIRPKLTRYPTVISRYVSPHRNSYLLAALHQLIDNKHSDACIYLPPYKLDVLKITYFNKVL